jgi:ABC-type antimicrobial peptide transport system ATPase subunit
MKLHFLANQGNGRRVDADVGVWVKRGREWEWEKWRKMKLSEVYMDVGLTGQPHQVSQIL